MCIPVPRRFGHAGIGGSSLQPHDTMSQGNGAAQKSNSIIRILTNFAYRSQAVLCYPDKNYAVREQALSNMRAVGMHVGAACG